MMNAGAAIGAGAGALFGGIGAIVGAIAQAESAREAARLRRQAYEEYDIDLQQLDAALRDYGIPESALAQIRESDETLGRQQSVWDELEGIKQAKGMDPGFLASLNQAQNNAGKSYAANSGAVMRQLAGAGMQNSPMKYAMLQQQAADAANVAGDMGLKGVQMGQDRYIHALDAMEGLSGRMRDQDFRTLTTKANATDEMNKWNKQMAFDAVNQQMQAIENNNRNKQWKASGRANALAGQAQGVMDSGNMMANNIRSGMGQAGMAAYGAGQLFGGMSGDYKPRGGAYANRDTSSMWQDQELKKSDGKGWW